jgi:3-methyl-2-oxobutanoate hydroxymethyltransferase
MSTDNKTRVVTTYRLQEMKSRGEKIAMLTAYDYSMARIVDSAGVDVVLVGDSAANVMAGYETTVPMSLEHMIYHARSVTRAVKRALVVVDMPFGTYQGNSKEALASAVRIMKESEADAIKLEGGEEILESVQRILCAGIPVMGHLGLTPQSIHKYGTYSVRAKEEAEARKLIRDAHLLEAVGCFGIVLEKIPATLGAQVGTENPADRHRGRKRRRRTSAGDSRHAGDQQRIFAAFPPPLRRPVFGYDGRGEPLRVGRQKRRFPERKGAVLIVPSIPAA